MLNMILQEKLFSLRQEKDTILKQIEGIETERAKKIRKVTGLCEVIPDSQVDPEMRDLLLKVCDLKEQIKDISVRFLKRGKLTEMKAQGGATQ